MNRFQLVALLGLGAAALGGCGKKAASDPAPATPPTVVAATAGPLAVAVENVVGPDPLVLDTRTYASPAGEAFTVTKFNYYLSNFKLRRADGSEYAVPDSYFLVRETAPGSPVSDGKHFVLPNVPVGSYTGISFLIGVDEERNTAGAQTGALAPENGMFWSWNQGYIFLQMEGLSPQSGDTGSHLLAYHIGDFQRPNNLRVVAPPLPGGAAIEVQAGRTPELHLRANLLRLFESYDPQLSNPVRFGPTWSAVGGAAAGRFATNYSGSAERGVPGTNSMFSVVAVHGH